MIQVLSRLDLWNGVLTQLVVTQVRAIAGLVTLVQAQLVDPLGRKLLW
jgi:hypothetical protein